MKSTSGAHYPALDHIRALAALMVFVWHFTHGPKGEPVPFAGTTVWGPLVFFDEGHVGVALFMTLSGYLFAKLLEGKQIRFPQFLWNRTLRLLPLLAVILLVNAAIRAFQGGDLRAGYWFILSLPNGLVLPTWPNGGWSITVELHFYLLLPLLLFLQRKSPVWLLLVLSLAVGTRTLLYLSHGEVQTPAYLTIIGRIDQFVLGMLAFGLRRRFERAHIAAALTAIVFTTIYFVFASQGGFYLLDGYGLPCPLSKGLASRC